MLELLGGEIERTEQWLEENRKGDRRVERLLSVPGLGRLLAVVIGLGSDPIERFANPSKPGWPRPLMPRAVMSPMGA